jgi:peptidoglycan lytic transglycosylase G
MTIRGGGRPRDSQAHLADVEIDEEHYARAPDPLPPGGRGRRPSARAGGRPPQAPRGRGGFGLGGLVRFVLFIGVLAVIVLAVALTVLRPVVASAVVGWAGDNPSALRLPFVADLVREDLGKAMTDPPSTDASEVEFTVLEGDTAASIAARLADAGFLTDARSFVFISTEKNLADKLEAGTYILRKNMTPDQLVNALLVSRDIAVTVGLREGLRLEQITAKLQTLPLTMDVKAFYEEVESPPKSLLADYPWLDLPAGASLEGFLAPATYRVLPDITPDTLIRRMLDRFYETVGPDRLNVPKTRGLSFYEVLTLASIVEREAVLDEERPLIAGVYQNRLDNAPRILNADPTVLYANDTMQLARLPFADWKTYAFWAPPGGPLKELLVTPELAGYQSYIVAGLPPRPICTPTTASIDAALEPNDKAGYFYFVAIPDSGGKHAFAKTYKEHQANLKKYGY